MKRDKRLYPLSWGHHHGLVRARRTNVALPEADGRRLAEMASEVRRFWKEKLLPHFRAEEECLLPRLACHVELDDPLLRRTLRDHVAIHRLVLKAQEATGPEEQREVLARFAALLTEHIRYEERVLFQQVEALLSDGEMDALAGELSEALDESHR